MINEVGKGGRWMNETVGGWEGGRGGGLKVDVGLLSLDTSCLQRRSTPPPQPTHTHIIRPWVISRLQIYVFHETSRLSKHIMEYPYYVF